jgi:Alkylmercury lyase.
MNEEILNKITSQRPTNFRIIEQDGKEIYVYCALDVLLYAVLTCHNITIETILSGKNIRFKLDTNSELILSFINLRDAEKLPPSHNTPSNICPYLRFFANLEEFEDWRNTLPEEIRHLVIPKSVKEVLSIIKRYVISSLDDG